MIRRQPAFLHRFLNHRASRKPKKARLDNSASLRDFVEKYRTELLPLYSLLSEILKEILTEAAKEAGISAIVQARPKGIPNFAEKMVRKNYSDPFRQMTDLCGARVITESEGDNDTVCCLIKRLFVVDERNSMDTIERLGHSEFGYRSVHFVVSLKAGNLQGVLPRARERLLVANPEWHKHFEDAGTTLLEEFRFGESNAASAELGTAPPEPRFKAEIQLRTLLQHAWAATSHDQFYKGDFVPPDQLKRECSRAAALLEEAESSFTRIGEDLHIFQTYHGPYRQQEQRKAEIERLTAVSKFDQSLGLALRISRLTSSGPHREWKTSIRFLRPFVSQWRQSKTGARLISLAARQGKDRNSPYRQEEFDTRLRELADPDLAPALVQYGRALWNTAAHQKEKSAARRILEWSTLLDCNLPDAQIALADSLRNEKRWKEALKHYERAIKAAPSEPRAWRKFLVAKIQLENSLSFTAGLAPALNKAIEVCRRRAQIQVYLPQAYFDIGLFHLALNRPYEALSAYARAASLCESAGEILSPYRQLCAIGRALQRNTHTGQPEGLEWALLLLALALNAKPDAQSLGNRLPRLQQLRTKTRDSFLEIPSDKPVLIVAGGTMESELKRIESYFPLLRKALAGFQGTIFCGGTTAGVSGVVGRLPLAKGEARRIAYLPRKLPRWTRRDPAHYNLFKTNGASFSPREPLQNWIDVLASGVNPKKVRVLGINGGSIAGFEYRLALALGATVAVFPESGRAATQILQNEDWMNARGLCAVPQDACTIAELVHEVPNQEGLLGKNYRTQRAKAGHEKYRRERFKDFSGNDPALKPWGEWTFVEAHIEDLPSLARKLRRKADGVSAFLSRKLDSVARGALAKYRGLTPDPSRLLPALVGNLNKILAGRCIYKDERFAAVNLRPETRELLIQDPGGENLIQLNRLLLEDAYPGALSKLDVLSPHFKASNLKQVDHIVLKLKAVGMTIRKTNQPAVRRVVLRQDQLEFLAELEHGRWNAEKLRDGWKWAEKTDKNRKLHQLLVPWSQLSDKTKQWDRDPIVDLFHNLQQDGFSIEPADNKHHFVKVPGNPGQFYILPP